MLALAILAASCVMPTGGGADLHGLTRDGGVVRIDRVSGALTPLGQTAIPVVDAATGMACHILGLAPDGRILSIDAPTGTLRRVVAMTGLPTGGVPVAIGLDENFFHVRRERVFVVVAEPIAGDVLYVADLASGVYTPVGPTGRRGLRGLAGSWAITAERDLFQVDLLTGAARPVATSGPPHTGRFEDVVALDGSPYAVNAGLWRIGGDGPNGEALWVPLSARGLEEVRGLAAVDPIAYADCDTSTGPNRLDIFDFLMFDHQFDAADPHACDCDTQTGFGVCDVFDYLCYITAFVGQCP